MGNTLGAAEWNTNVLQQGNWTQEVLLGTNADKIPGAALSYPLAVPDGTASGLKIGSRARVGTVGNGLYSSNNAVSPDGGTTWNRDDTTKAAFLYAFGPQDAATGQNMTIYRAAAGANPITWVTLFDIDAGGTLTGAGFFRSTELTITAGATATVAHGLVTRPSFVFGLWCPNSGGGITEKFVVGTNAAAATPYFDTVGGTGMDATNIRVVNGAATTSLVIVNAIK